jgi:hypothetical protein
MVHAELHKRLDVSLKKDFVIIGILGFLSCVPVTVTTLLISTSQGKYFPPPELLWASILSVLGLPIALFLLREIPPLFCFECKKQFAIRRIKHIRIKTKVLSRSEEKIIREFTYYDTFRCDFCKNEWSKPIVVTRSLRIRERD